MSSVSVNTDTVYDVVVFVGRGKAVTHYMYTAFNFTQYISFSKNEHLHSFLWNPVSLLAPELAQTKTVSSIFCVAAVKQAADSYTPAASAVQ